METSFRQQFLRERLLTVLARRGPCSAVELTRELEISQPTLSRLLATVADRVLFLRRTRNRRYALARDILHDAADLFGEAPSMAFVTVKEADLSCLTLMAEDAGVQAVRIGTTGGDTLSVKNLFDIPVKDIVAASRKPL